MAASQATPGVLARLGCNSLATIWMALNGNTAPMIDLPTPAIPPDREQRSEQLPVIFHAGRDWLRFGG